MSLNVQLKKSTSAIETELEMANNAPISAPAATPAPNEKSMAIAPANMPKPKSIAGPIAVLDDS